MSGREKVDGGCNARNLLKEIENFYECRQKVQNWEECCSSRVDFVCVFGVSVLNNNLLY